MRKSKPAASPDAYVAALSGWQRPLVEHLRAAVTAASKVDEVVKWRNLVYLSNGPVMMIRAEEERVLFGFWRGKRLREIDERVKASGKYEMGTIVLREGMSLAVADARKLARAAIRLNKTLGDPTKAGKPQKRAK